MGGDVTLLAGGMEEGKGGNEEVKSPAHRSADVLCLAATFRKALPEAHGPVKHQPLVERELEILGLIRQGLPGGKIGNRLALSFTTANWHLRQIFSKLDVHRVTACPSGEPRSPLSLAGT